jgi:hypothetical protein
MVAEKRLTLRSSHIRGSGRQPGSKENCLDDYTEEKVNSNRKIETKTMPDKITYAQY